MEIVISLILIITAFIIIVSYWDFPSDNKVEQILMSNKQKKNYALIVAYGFLIFGIYLLLKAAFF
jgi:hypothetical protein